MAENPGINLGAAKRVAKGGTVIQEDVNPIIRQLQLIIEFVGLLQPSTETDEKMKIIKERVKLSKDIFAALNVSPTEGELLKNLQDRGVKVGGEPTARTNPILGTTKIASGWQSLQNIKILEEATRVHESVHRQGQNEGYIKNEIPAYQQEIAVYRQFFALLGEVSGEDYSQIIGK
jgi:hypothetical protein